MNDVKPCIVVSFLLALFFFVGCDDNPMTPESGIISGVVDFSGAWPETGNISISLNTSWPEVTGAPYAFTTIYSDDLNQDNLYNYRFENVTFGTYQGIIVSWKDPHDDDSVTNQHAIGGYGGTAEAEFENTGSITVSGSDYEIMDLNFPAYLDLIDETIPAESGTISGTVTFSGTWPTGTVFMSLNSLWPLQTTPIYYSTIASENLIDNKYSYSFENVTFGIYTIAVVWLNPNASWETLGAYGSTTICDSPSGCSKNNENDSWEGCCHEDAESVTITVTDFELTGLDFIATFSD